MARLALSQQSSRQTSPPTTRREMKPISISPVVPPRVAAGTRGRYDFALVGKRPVLGGSTLRGGGWCGAGMLHRLRRPSRTCSLNDSRLARVAGRGSSSPLTYRDGKGLRIVTLVDKSQTPTSCA